MITTQSRDLTPGSSQELTETSVNIWAHPLDGVLPTLPDKSETPLGEGIKRRGETVRVPDRMAYVNAAIPGTAATGPILTPLAACQTPQNGVIVSLKGIISNWLPPAGGVCTISLQNYEGNVYISSILLGNATAAQSFSFWDFQDLHFPFTRGLYLALSSGATVGSYVGEVSACAVWHA